MSKSEFEIFISYARKDDVPAQPGEPGWVVALRDEIVADHRRFSTEPLRIFFDTREIRDMDDWRHRILAGLRTSRILLVCLSPRYFRSDYCRWEWDEYQSRQVHQQLGVEGVAAVYFVEVPGSDESGAAKWSDELLRSNFTDLRSWYPNGVRALHDEEVRRRIATLGESLWERIRRVRRADGVPGNLRRVNPHFVGRRSELRELHEKLRLGSIGVLTALQGLGGQGKTELAVAYAHGFADCYPAGLWLVAAEGKRELLPALGDLASDLGLPLSLGPEESEDRRGRRVLAELKRRAGAVRATDPDGGAACLILCDNVSEPELLGEVQLAKLPREDWFRILATTRLGADELGASRRASLALVAVDALQPADALALIEGHQLDERFASDADREAARELVRELGGFTLAVEAVAVYLGLHPDLRPADYLARLREEGLPSSDALGAESDVAAQMQHREKQFALVLAQTLGRVGPLERDALAYAALLPPDSIPWAWLFELLATEHADALAARPGYPDPKAALRRRLAGLRLLTDGEQEGVARMHRYVSAHVLARLRREGAYEARLERVVQLLRTAAGRIESLAQHDPRELWALVPLQRSVDLYRELRSAELAAIADIVGGIEMSVGRLAVAFPYLEFAITTRDALLRANPGSASAARDVSVSLNQLGDFYVSRGQSGDAVRALACFEKSLAMAEDLLGANPGSASAARDVSVSLNRLGDVYASRGQSGDPERALACLEKCRQTLEELLRASPGSASAARDVSVSLDKLGKFYVSRGQSGDAERALTCFEKSLKAREELLRARPGSASAVRDVSVSFEQLGDLYVSRGQSGDAERALACFERSLGMAEELLRANPGSASAARDVSVSLNKLGDFYVSRGQSGDAERALARFEKSLGMAEELLRANPGSASAARDVSVSLNMLGDFYVSRGQSRDAARALACFEKSLGMAEELLRANPGSASAARDVSVLLNKLGDFYVSRGQSGDAERALACFEKALDAREHLLRANPGSASAARDVSVSLNKLGDFYVSRSQSGNAERALACFERCQQTLEDLLRANPGSASAARDVSVSLGRLGDFYVSRGQSGDAERALACFEKSLDGREDLLRANPGSASAARDVLVSLERMATVVGASGTGSAAIDALGYQSRALEIALRLSSDNPTSTFLGQTLVRSFFNSYTWAAEAGERESAMECLNGCYTKLREMISAGQEVDAELRDLYDRLTSQLGGG